MQINTNKYSFLDSKLTIWIPFFLGLVVIATVGLYINFPSGYNQGIYHYQGLVLKNGGLPYTGFIEKKGPMGLLTYSLASLIFGETVMGYRIFDLLILAITAFFLFRLSRLNLSKSISWLVIVFWLPHVLIDGPGNTGDVTNIITTCYVALAYYLLAPKHKNKCFIAGVLIALACWVKPTAILIAIPLLSLIFLKNKNVLNEFNWKKNSLKFLLGMEIPTLIFLSYLVLSNTFYAFWEVVVLDNLFNYAGNVSRFSFRIIAKTGWTFLNDPILRLGGLLSLFIFSKNTLIKLMVIGIGLMLFVEGRLYPYQFSILWPFLTLGVVEGFITLSRKTSEKKRHLLIGLFCLIMSFPVFKTSVTFLNAGFLTKSFNPAKIFILPDFELMYTHRKSVANYLKKQMHPQDEVFVLGQDPNIYLELGAITRCRLARSNRLLTREPTPKTPHHIIAWQQELITYMHAKKADWIIVLKTLPGQWASIYKQEINTIFLKEYELNYSTQGHLIYKKIASNDKR